MISSLCRKSMNGIKSKKSINRNYKHNKESKRPSPTRKIGHSYAQNRAAIIHSLFFACIKRISRFVSCEKRYEAGMTIEAAAVLPLLIFFLLNLSSVMEMIRLHGNLELAITNTGNALTVYGYVSERAGLADAEEASGMLEELAETAVSYLLVKESLEQFLGEEYLDGAPLVGGTDGILGTTWEFTEKNDVVQITLGYVLQCPFAVPELKKTVMMNHYYGHIWNGYEIPGTAEGNGLETVYVTAYGSVFHDALSCSHLDLSIREVELAELRECRNADGEVYVLCSYCGEDAYEGNVYITNWGECYHYQENCSGLVRKIYSMTLTEALQGGLRICSRCEQEE